MSGADRSLRASLMRGVTAVAEPVYCGAAGLRNKLFDWGLRGAAKAHCPVISVGNITTGGTGKTPMAVYLVERLRAMGRTPAVVMRGYKQSADRPSDEAVLLRETLGDVPVVTDPDRVAAARRIATDHPAVDVIVLDDGFQHRRIARDLDIVLVDAANPFGYDRVLPRGLLRESLGGLRRADAVIVTRSPLLGDPARAGQLDTRIGQLHGKAPIAHFTHQWARVIDESDEPVELSRTSVLTFCGIGNPRAFFGEAAERCEVTDTVAFADHHAYTEDDVRSLMSRMRDNGAEALLTTEKDWVKLRGLLESMPERPMIRRVVLSLACLRGEADLQELLRKAIALE